MTKALGSFRFFVVALIAIAVLAVVSQPSSTTRAARVAHLESVVKCPACDSLTVGQSNAPSSVAIRHQIERMVNSGRSDGDILSALQSQYGSNITVTPSTAGIGVLLWAVPVVLALGGIVTVARVGRRQ
jgi:cytochrome c-type biogenesis protein CcmH/NrfF